MMASLRGVASLLGLLLPLLMSIDGARGLAVMSVDLGSEWMKTAVVSPGVPMEICLNRDSQRKTPVVVAFRDGERQFGDLALNTQVKFPAKAFSNFLDLLGKPLDHPVVQDYIVKFPFHNLSSSSSSSGGNAGPVVFTHPEGMTFTVEELVAMMLKQAQVTAQTTAGQTIKNAVITVPAFFNQAERRALSRAAHIAGIHVLQLINDNTAVALNYGAFRRKEFNATPVNILFYDMGTGSTKATVVSYQTAKTKDRGYVETAPIMTVRGVGFDRSLGGLEFRLRLREHLANKFDELRKTSTKCRDNVRAMFKLYKEAERVKKILSANNEINAQVENVMEDVDFKLPVSRQEFEEMCSDLLARVTKPIDDALTAAQIPLEEISQVIVVGGNTRVPRIQAILEEYLQGKGLGKSINADEAAAMGGAYQAAYLSKGFKVKTFVTKDANLYPIQVEFSRDGVKNIQRVVFNRNNEFPKKKTIIAARMETDFTVYVNYGDLTFLSKKDQLMVARTSNISSLLIRGVAESLKKHPSTEAEVKGVRMHMAMDASGIFRIEQVETLFEKETVEAEEESTLSRIGSTLGKLFGGGEGGEKSDDTLKDAKDEQEPAGQATKEQAPKDNAQKKTATEEATKTAEPPKKVDEKDDGRKKPEEKKDSDGKKDTKKLAKKVEIREALERDVTVLDMPSLSGDDLSLSHKKLQDLDDADKARLALDKARNALEAFIHETRDKLATDEYEKASTEKERASILNALNKDQEWLEYESDEADTETLKGKLATLAVVTKDVTERVNEHRERPQALSSLDGLLKVAEDYLNGLKKLSEDDSVFTKVELDTLEKVITETRAWMVEQKAIQDKTPLNEAPKLTMKAIFEKIQVLDRETKYLMNKARYAPPKKKAKSGEPKQENQTSSEDGGEPATDEAEEIVPGTDEDDRPIEASVKSDSASPLPEESGNGDGDQPGVPDVEQQPQPPEAKDETAHSEL